jgi:hypothetical protein
VNIKTTLFLILICASLTRLSQAQGESAAGTVAPPEVEWYPPETEKSRFPDRAKVILSGRTLPGSLIQVDGESITVLNQKPVAEGEPSFERQLRINCKAYEKPDGKSKVVSNLQKGAKVMTHDHPGRWIQVIVASGSGYVSESCFSASKIQAPQAATVPQKIESAETHTNAEGFFELALELPQGLSQIPVQVTSPQKSQKTFLISFEVNISAENIKMNTKVSRRKPPAAGKKFRLWGGLGFTRQTYSQSTSGASDLAFQTMQAPGITLRGGYWGDRWGLDFYFRDAPGKIEADAPFKVQSDSYHWRTLEAKGLYQFERTANSRLMGLPSQWQLRFGTQFHQIPFLEIDNTSTISVSDQNVTTATLGVGLLLAQEQDWSYEFALGLQRPLSASLTISSPVAFEAQLGAAFKFAPNWRLGVFSYTQSMSHSYQFQTSNGLTRSGQQNLFYTTFDLRLGYEF